MSSALWWVMNGFAAAPPAWLEQHRRLDLVEASFDAARARVAAITAERIAKTRARGLVEDQVEVALPVAGLGVGDAVADVGQRPQALREQLEARQPRPTARRGRRRSPCPRRRSSRRGRGRRSRGAPRRRPRRGSTISWIAPVSSCRSAKSRPPWRRSPITRPARCTTLPVSRAGGEVVELLVDRRGGRVAVEADRVRLDARARAARRASRAGARESPPGTRRARRSSRVRSPRWRSPAPILGRSRLAERGFGHRLRLRSREDRHPSQGGGQGDQRHDRPRRSWRAATPGTG